MKKRVKSKALLPWKFDFDLKMKLSLFIACLITVVGQANSAYSQRTKISLKLDNVSILTVMDEIEEKTEFRFIFNTKAVDTDQKISINITKKRIDQILPLLFPEGDTFYEIYDRKILLKKTKPQKLDQSSNTLPIIIEQFQVTGIVTDQDGGPLPAANIVEKGTVNGVTTDFDGSFSIRLEDENAILVVSYIGFTTKEVPVDGQTTLNISLEESTSGLGEVVVIGYGSVKKSDLTGSVASIKSEDLNSFPTADAIQALQGRAAGVVVQSANGGEPGADYTITIRGNTSINSSNNPLIVVDGFPRASLPPAQDIKSIEILKDASATAIYGSRGANGVVMVTTKRGKPGKPTINYSGSFSTQEILNEYDLLDARQFAEYMNELDVLGGNAPNFTNPTSLGTGTDWQNEILQTGFIQDHNLSVSGGSDDVRYYVSGTFYDQEGIIMNSDFKRYSLTSNLDAKISRRARMGVNLFVRRHSSNQISSQEGTPGSQGGGTLTSALVFTPTVGVLDSDGITYSTDPNLLGFDNPIAMIRERTSENITDYLQSSVNLEYDVTNHLKFRTVFGATISNGMLGRYESSRLFFAGGFGGIATITTRKNTSLLSENYFTYTNSFGREQDHALTVLAGFSYGSDKSANVTSKASGFLTDSSLYWNLGSAAVFERPSSFLGERELISYYGRINYNYKDRYLLTATGRNDGSSTLAEGNKWNFFPSGAFAWNMHNENFLSQSNVFSRVKLRASYGISGNQSVAEYSSLAKLRFVLAVFNGSPVNAVSPLSLANTELTWERTEQADFGVDLGLLNDKIMFTADYYDMTTSRLLFEAPIPAYIGVGNTYLKNIGKTGNKGIELSLQVRDIIKPIKWNTSFNISFNKNVVKKLPDDGADIFYSSRPGNFVGINNTHVLREGEPIGLMYGYVYEGVQQSGDELLTGAEGIGGERFRDITPDGILDEEDRTVIGDPNPDFSWGWNNSFDFKGFDLNIFLQGVQGNDMLNYSRFWLEDGVGRRNSTTAMLDRWTPSNTDTDVPSASITRIQRLSSRWIEDGSYIRLKNITFGYSLPYNIINRLGINSLKIFVSGQNLWTQTDYKGFDPEVGSSGSSLTRGIDFGSYPNTRNFTLGVNFGF